MVHVPYKGTNPGLLDLMKMAADATEARYSTPEQMNAGERGAGEMDEAREGCADRPEGTLIRFES
jgi:hypothetical protein